VKAVVMSDLEIDRGRKQARVDAVESYSDLLTKVRHRKKSEPTHAEVLAA